MKKVLIVTIPKQDVVRPPGIQAILAACCESVNYDYEIFDVNLLMHKSLPNELIIDLNADFYVNEFKKVEHKDAYLSVCNKLVEKIEDYKPDWIAISVFTIKSILAAHELLKLLNSTSNRKNYKIVIGGIGLTDTEKSITDQLKFGDYCLTTKLVDHAIYGEGELSFIELLKGNLNYPGIDQNPPQQILDLDSLPSPSYHKINPSDYFYSEEPEVLVTGSKGCVKSCTFCDVGSIWNRYVYKSGKTIANELFNIWKNTGVQKFEFSDSLLNGSIKSFREFNKQLIELKAQNPGFTPRYKGQFIARPKNQLKAIDYDEMKLAGIETITIGIESFSEKIRYDVKKSFDDESLDWHLSQCARLNIQNMFLLFSGYVTETINDHQIGLDILKKYQKYALTRIISMLGISPHGFTMLPGSPIHDMQHEFGIKMIEDYNWISVNNLSLTPKERLRRTVELTLTAVKLGYSVAHIDELIGNIQRLVDNLDQNSKKLFSILKHTHHTPAIN